MSWLFQDSAVYIHIYESILPQLSSHPGRRWAEFPCAQHWYFWTYHSTVILFHFFFFWMAKRTTSHKIRVGFPGYVYGWEIKFSVSIASISSFLVSFNAISSDLRYPSPPIAAMGTWPKKNVKTSLEHWYLLLLMISLRFISFAWSSGLRTELKAGRRGGLFILERSVLQVVKTFPVRKRAPKQSGQGTPSAQSTTKASTV